MHCVCAVSINCFGKKNLLKDHIKRHLKERSFTCQRCEFRTHDHTNLIHHVKSVHEKLAASRCCSFLGCNYSTAHRSAFKRHHRNHHSDPLVRRPFPCNYTVYTVIVRNELTKNTHHCHNLYRTKISSAPCATQAVTTGYSSQVVYDPRISIKKFLNAPKFCPRGLK